MAHWGMPTNIRPRQVNPFGDFAILEFAPTGDAIVVALCNQLHEQQDAIGR
jgi:hypothetical protein